MDNSLFEELLLIAILAVAVLCIVPFMALVAEVAFGTASIGVGASVFAGIVKWMSIH